MNIKKKLMLLGAGRGHLGVVRTAKELGINIVVVTMEGDYPCLDYADKICYGDISKPDVVLEIARKENIDGILICCSDTGLRSVGYVSDKLDLCGLSEESAIMCANKYLMKNALESSGIRTARFKKIANQQELSSALEELQFPVIIKSTDLQGSRGIYVAKTASDAIDGFNLAIKETKQSYCIVEEFIEGLEFGAQALVYKGEILFIMPHNDETLMCNTPVPIGHSIPFTADIEVLNDIYKQSELSIRSLNLDNCAVNIDYILKDNKVYIIELTGRVGANCLPELVGIKYGLDYYKMVILMALGEDPNIEFNKRILYKDIAYAKMLFSETSGNIKNVSLPKNDEYQVEFFKKKGDDISIFKNSNDAIGQIIVKGKTMNECNNKISEFVKQIKIDFN